VSRNRGCKGFTLIQVSDLCPVTMTVNRAAPKGRLKSGHLSGWRVSEMRTLEWRDVDLPGRELCLHPDVSKNKDGRPLPLRGELLEIIRRAHEKRRADCRYVFLDEGEPISDFRKTWEVAKPGVQ
jgi:integrase